MADKDKTLIHLKNVIPIEGYPNRLSAYLVSLEGWRRGLDLKFIRERTQNNGLMIKFILTSDQNEIIFRSSMSESILSKTIEICENKELTKQYLSANNVPTPNGMYFSETVSDQDIVSKVKSLSYPLVLKPVDGSGGKGVVVNIKNNKELFIALSRVRTGLGLKDVIVEEFVQGDEFRVVVLDGQVIGAINRVPANVIGDGKKTIKNLIKEKNERRKENPHLQGRLIKINRETTEQLKKINKKYNDIPKEGEVIWLRDTSNISTGGDSENVTDMLTNQMKKNAVNAVAAIPGLVMAGVDMIVDVANDVSTVLEVNTRPGLGGHVFPYKGKPIDLPKKIIDYYFPETMEKERMPFYFEFKEVLNGLRSRTLEEAIITPCPQGKFKGSLIIIKSAEVNKIRGIRNIIRRFALKNCIHGWMQLENDKSEVKIAVYYKEEELFYQIEYLIHSYINKHAISFQEYIVELYEAPVKLGFEIQTNIEGASKKNNLNEENIMLHKKMNAANKELDKIKRSTSWRISAPVRAMGSLIKKLQGGR